MAGRNVVIVASSAAALLASISHRQNTSNSQTEGAQNAPIAPTGVVDTPDTPNDSAIPVKQPSLDHAEWTTPLGEQGPAPTFSQHGQTPSFSQAHVPRSPTGDQTRPTAAPTARALPIRSCSVNEARLSTSESASKESARCDGKAAALGGGVAAGVGVGQGATCGAGPDASKDARPVDPLPDSLRSDFSTLLALQHDQSTYLVASP